MVASPSKCRVCREPAIIDLPRHNANFCAAHLLQLCRRQVEKAIADHDMLSAGDRVLVAVSGGKDSLAVWDILLELGYHADGLYLGLGIGGYSDESGEYAHDFASQRGLSLRTIDLREEYGYELIRTKPVDMFPHTPHVESVSLLTRERGSRQIAPSRSRCSGGNGWARPSA